ncbi:YggT family protein [Haemophilus influenzae]|uniref:YggT family protein n=1 Tax=Haemophilus influenzae TaxID=727 RepID=UPI000DD4E35C|nr:YggT family protein [Haemophilus influenzae]MCK8935025.1 YggT family protein [Haemophilus influenzae]MCK8938892.1 YggT family protein [Haemophilus influenzae]MCK9070038.1 YggT family protein [Haemophilus influenzae]
MELSQTALFIGSIINLYALVLILRAWLQFARVDYYNSVSTFAVKMTDPVLKPLRKIAPTVKNIDTSALLLVFIIGMLKGIIYFGLSVNVLLVLGVLTVLKSIGLAIFYVLFIGAVLSWFNRGNNSISYAFYQLSEPLLKPIRRFLPTLGMIDFSPMVVVFILLFLNNFMLDLLGGLWIIAG